MRHMLLFSALVIGCATPPSPTDEAPTRGYTPADPIPEPPRPIDDVLREPHEPGSRWYVYDKGTGQFAAVVGSQSYADAGDISVSFETCHIGDRFRVDYDGGLSVDLAPTHHADARLTARQGEGKGSSELPGSYLAISTPGKQTLSLRTEATIATDAPCSFALQLRSPQNEGADSIAVESWAVLRATPL